MQKLELAYIGQPSLAESCQSTGLSTHIRPSVLAAVVAVVGWVGEAVEATMVAGRLPPPQLQHAAVARIPSASA